MTGPHPPETPPAPVWVAEGPAGVLRPDRATDFVGLTAHLCRTANAVRTCVERIVLHSEGLHWSVYDVLVVICVRGAVRAKTVAVEVGIAKGTLTPLVATLIGRGLIRRQVNPSDRRSVLLCPTRAGIDLVRRLQPRIAHMETRLTERLADETTRRTVLVLRHLARCAMRLQSTLVLHPPTNRTERG